MSQELTEYHLQLATFNQTRRLWGEIYLEIARPPEQIELDLMREVLKMNLVSHLKRTEIKGQELFRTALLEEGNAETVRRQIVHALKAGKTVVNSTLDVGGVCFWIPAIRLDKDTGVLKVQAFAGNPLAESSLHRTFENSSRVLGSALKEFADSEEWELRWPRVNVEVQQWFPVWNPSTQPPEVRFVKHGNSFFVGGDVFRDARGRLMEAVSNPLEPPANGNVFLPIDEAFFSGRDLPYLRPFAGNAAFEDVPISIAPAEGRGWPAREVIDLRAEAVCGTSLPSELSAENAVFLSAVRVPVSARTDVESPRNGIGLLVARYLVGGQEEEKIFTFEEMARGQNSFFDFCKGLRGRTIVLSPGVYGWNHDLTDELSLVSNGLLEGIKEPCELKDCYAHFELPGNAQSPEDFAKAFRFTLKSPPPAFTVGETSTALELLPGKRPTAMPDSMSRAEGSYYSRALERCRWETKVFMHAWKQIGKRIAVMFRTEPDLEKVVDGVPWRVIVSGKIDAALAAVEECKTCTRGLALNPLSGKEAAHLDRTGSLLGRKNVVPSRS